MSPLRWLIRQLGALLIAALGTVGVFALSLGMNAQVVKKEEAVATVVQAVIDAPPTKKASSKQKARSAPAKKARRAAPSASPMLAAGLSGLDFGLPGGEDAALVQATSALMADAGAEIKDEADVEDPPRPESRTPPSFPARARSQNQSGAVTLAFVVDIDGSVQDVQVVEATPPGVFDEAAIEAVKSWRFSPGRQEGAPVAVRVRQTLRFELE